MNIGMTLLNSKEIILYDHRYSSMRIIEKAVETGAKQEMEVYAIEFRPDGILYLAAEDDFDASDWSLPYIFSNEQFEVEVISNDLVGFKFVIIENIPMVVHHILAEDLHLFHAIKDPDYVSFIRIENDNDIPDLMKSETYNPLEDFFNRLKKEPSLVL